MTHLFSDLRYRLVSGPIQIEPLRILDSRTVSWNDWTVTFHILGSSHAVTFKRGNARITELLTCALAEGETDAHINLVGDRTGEGCAVIQPDSLMCRVKLSPTNLTTGDNLLLAVDDQRLDYQFEGQHAGQCPVTRVGWTMEPNLLQVETIHTYPESGDGVRSRSLFTILRSDSE